MTCEGGGGGGEPPQPESLGTEFGALSVPWGFPGEMVLDRASSDSLEVKAC